MKNDYTEAMGAFYDETPKDIFAALAYSYAATFGTSGQGSDETTDPDEVVRRLVREWLALLENAIIRRFPPKSARCRIQQLNVKITDGTV
jgi:hypothetical protein